MNQSKILKILSILLIICFCTIALFQVQNHGPSYHPSYGPSVNAQTGELVIQCPGFSWDACNVYTPIINGESKVTNWHSALYMYECRAALRCAKLLSAHSDGMRIQIFLYYLHLGAFLLCTSLLLYYFIRTNCAYSLLLIPLCCSTHYIFKTLPLGLDFFFFVHFVIMSTVLACVCRIKGKHMRILAWIIIAITLFHAVNFRKNSVLLIPFVAYIYTYIRYKTREKRMVRLSRWVLITILFSFISTNIVAWVFPVTHLNPMAPMMSSDVRIAAVLRGEQGLFRETLRNSDISATKLNHEYKDSLTAAEFNELDVNQNLRACQMYTENWKQNTGSMLMARFIQTVEFYSGGIVHPMMQKWVERLYPAVQGNPNAWKMRCGMTSMERRVRMLVMLAGVAVLCLLLLQRFKCGHWKHPHAIIVVLPCLAALIYAGSFTIVPPTADARYLAPSLFIIWNACWAWLAFTLCDIEKRKALFDAHSRCEEK